MVLCIYRSYPYQNTINYIEAMSSEDSIPLMQFLELKLLDAQSAEPVLVCYDNRRYCDLRTLFTAHYSLIVLSMPCI